MSFEDGVKLPLGILTAAAGLYNTEHLHLPYPSLIAQKTGKTILIWGGSSNVGIAAVQLSVASGVDVVAVASEANWDLVREAGASKTFSQHSRTAINDLVGCLKGKEVVGAFDGMSDHHDLSTRHFRRDADTSSLIAIGSVEATSSTAQVLAHLGGGKLASVFNRFGDVPDSVQAKQGKSDTNV